MIVRQGCTGTHHPNNVRLLSKLPRLRRGHPSHRYCVSFPISQSSYRNLQGTTACEGTPHSRQRSTIFATIVSCTVRPLTSERAVSNVYDSGAGFAALCGVLTRISIVILGKLSGFPHVTVATEGPRSAARLDYLGHKAFLGLSVVYFIVVRNRL